MLLHSYYNGSYDYVSNALIVELEAEGEIPRLFHFNTTSPVALHVIMNELLIEIISDQGLCIFIFQSCVKATCTQCK